MAQWWWRVAAYFGAHRVDGLDGHERDRARQRIAMAVAIALLVAGQIAWGDAREPTAWLVLALSSAYALVAAAHLRWVLAAGRRWAAGQYLLIVCDSVLTVVALVGAPQLLGPLYPVLIVQIVRCGMRYGMRTLWLAWGAAALAAAALMPFSVFWLAEPLLLRSFVVTMLVIPLLMGPLIRRLQQANEALREEAGTDPLTGAGNRRLLERELANALESSRHGGGMTALLLFDLDNFKRVNDQFGHDRGDALLVRVVECMRARARAGDVVGRIGGDEFVLLLHGLPAEGGIGRARALADAVVGEVRLQAELLVPGQGVSASAGISCWAPHHGPAPSPAQLLRQADEAMYAAKRAGKSRSVLAAVA